MPITLPSDAVVDAIHGTVTQVTRRVEFYEYDGVTPWEPEGADISLPVLGGSVSIDASRDERRMADVEIYNESGLYRITKNGLWYDKVVKVYRGVDYDGDSYESLLGTFYIDNMSDSHFPGTIQLTARDRTKILKKDKFATDTMFDNNDPVRDVIEAIAFNGGIPLDEQDLPVDMGSLYQDTYFDQGSPRWDAMKEIATAFKYDLYFKPDGTLVAEEFSDPATGSPEYTFQTGVNGNLAEYSRQLSDERIRNHIIVASQNAYDVPIYAEAENTDPFSPTSVERIGRRSDKYDLAHVGNVDQAQDLADVFLSVASLEQYELSMEAIPVPYIDVNIVVGFVDPDPVVGLTVLGNDGRVYQSLDQSSDPTEFLLQSVKIPLDLSTMSATAGRVTLAG